MKMRNVTIGLGWLLVLTACPVQKDLTPLKNIPIQERAAQTPHATADFDFCLHKALTRADYLKLIFVLDKSGSNAGDVNTPGSDPNGARRYGTLLAYLATIPQENQQNTFYSLVEFSTDVSIYPVPPVGTVNPTNFTNNLTDFTGKVRQKSNPNNANPANPLDGGWTDYKKALTAVKDIITKDITAASTANPPVTSHYVVIFVSDGQPVIPTGTEPTSDILNLIGDIRTFEISTPNLVGSVQLHTGYYFNDAIQDPLAQQLMQQMATKGNGDAYQFSTGQSIDFSRFQIPEDNVAFTLKDFLVDYVEGVWDDGEFKLASSGGMSDDLKARYNADPRKWDSDGNGISDLVEYKAFGKPCAGTHCEPQLASQFPNCAGFRTPQGTYTDTDGDGLNDCEEAILHSNMEDFDSNDAWLPDFLALKRGFGLNAGRGALALDSDGDNVPAYFELKYNTPLDYRNDLVTNLKPYTYHLTLASSNASQSCYHMTVSNITVLDPNHHLAAYLMEMPAALEAKKYLRTAVKPIGPGYHVSFSNGDFK